MNHILPPADYHTLSHLVAKYGLNPIFAGLVTIAELQMEIRSKDIMLASNWDSAKRILKETRDDLQHNCPEV